MGTTEAVMKYLNELDSLIANIASEKLKANVIVLVSLINISAGLHVSLGIAKVPAPNSKEQTS